MQTEIDRLEAECNRLWQELELATTAWCAAKKNLDQARAVPEAMHVLKAAGWTTIPPEKGPQ